MRTSIVALCAGCLLAVVSGSKILFDANPDVIQANLTDAMTMRCSLNDTVDVTGSPGSVVGKRDVSQTKENLQLVTSIVITRNNGDPVANIINGNARAQADLALMTVTGDTSGVMAEKGYLELKWQYPGTAQTGEYVCEVNAVDAQGHNVVFSTSVEIGESMPTIGELMGRVLVLEKEKQSMQQQLQDIANNISHFTPPTAAPAPSTTSTCCPAAASGGGSKPHIEGGYLDCGDSNGWRDDGDGDKSTTVFHKFSIPYRTTPFVQLGVTSIDHDENVNVRYVAEVIGLDQNGFTVKCSTWRGPEGQSHLYHIYMNWLSIER